MWYENIDYFLYFMESFP